MTPFHLASLSSPRRRDLLALLALFIVTLPFTASTKSVDKSAEMFIVRPFQFAFEREFESVKGSRARLEFFPRRRRDL